MPVCDSRAHRYILHGRIDYLFDQRAMKKKSNKRPIRNLCFYQGRWMTEHDKMVIRALNYAREIVPKENIIPRRNNEIQRRIQCRMAAA